MKLYISDGSCSIAAQILANEVEVPVELRHVDLPTKVTSDGRDFQRINPQGHVPVLDFEDGFFLSEQIAIHEYLADRCPELRLMPPIASCERLRVIELQSFIATALHQRLIPLQEGLIRPEAEDGLRSLLASHLSSLERRFMDGRSYLTGETFTVADAYLFAVLRLAHGARIDLAPYPGLTAFRHRVLRRPTVEKALRDASDAALCDAIWAA